MVAPALEVKKNWFSGVISLLTFPLAWSSFPTSITAGLGMLFPAFCSQENLNCIILDFVQQLPDQGNACQGLLLRERLGFSFFSPLPQSHKFFLRKEADSFLQSVSSRNSRGQQLLRP